MHPIASPGGGATEASLLAGGRGCHVRAGRGVTHLREGVLEKLCHKADSQVEGGSQQGRGVGSARGRRNGRCRAVEAGRIRASWRDCTAGARRGEAGGPQGEQARLCEAGNFTLGTLGSRGRFKQEKGLPWLVLWERCLTRRGKWAWGPVGKQEGGSGGLARGGGSGERSGWI